MPFKISKLGATVFAGFTLLAGYVNYTYSTCSYNGFIDFCKLGPDFFLLPITLLFNKEPSWWDHSKQDLNWIIVIGILYGLIAYLLISWVENKLGELDKS